MSSFCTSELRGSQPAPAVTLAGDVGHIPTAVSLSQATPLASYWPRSNMLLPEQGARASHFFVPSPNVIAIHHTQGHCWAPAGTPRGPMGLSEPIPGESPCPRPFSRLLLFRVARRYDLLNGYVSVFDD